MKKRPGVTVHAVLPKEQGGLSKFHTHGLEARGHKEFEIRAPAFLKAQVIMVLDDHVRRVVKGERFEHGETGEIGDIYCTYVEVPGDSPNDPTRLRIVELVEYNCCQCGCRERVL